MGDELKHKAQGGVGKVKEAYGDATNQDDVKAEGQKDQVAGQTKQVGDKVKDAASTLKDKLS